MKTKYMKIEGSNVPRYVNFNAVRFLWIEDHEESFCESLSFEGQRFQVLAEHDICLRAFPTLEEAEAYIEELIAELNAEDEQC